ncbi:hypothetical protein JOB18_023235 [Solea senegalensis]|uniref:Uncharacterized protein n=1 Tax=Solea senegalensis TaxID=28829 RepID=A0AAV6R7Q5_SOLSE|nr:hypothetical protein JOB18_023235 [Solea senegalensis]
MPITSSVVDAKKPPRPPPRSVQCDRFKSLSAFAPSIKETLNDPKPTSTERADDIAAKLGHVTEDRTGVEGSMNDTHPSEHSSPYNVKVNPQKNEAHHPFSDFQVL